MSRTRVVDINAQLTGSIGNAGDGQVDVNAAVVGVLTNTDDGVVNANSGASFSATVLNNGGSVTNNGGDLTVNTGQQLTGRQL